MDDTTQAPTGRPEQGKVKSAFAKRRRRRAWIIGGVALALVGSATAFGLSTMRPPTKVLAASDTTVLSATTLQNSISATGTVASAHSFKVFSTLTYAVDQVYVTVGQKVAQGDKLCDLSKASLDKQVAAKKAAIDQASGTSAAAVKSAQDKYDASNTALANGTNGSLVSAQTGVTNAQNAYDKAAKAYNDYIATLDAGQNATLLAQQTALDNATNSRTSAQYSFDKASADLDAASGTLASATHAYDDASAAAATAQRIVDQAGSSVTQQQLDDLAAAQSAQATAASARDAAQKVVDADTDVRNRASIALQAAASAQANAQAAYDATVTASGNSASDLKLAVDTARDALNSAQASYTAAQTAAKTELQLNQDGVKSSQAQASNAAAMQDLVNLNKDIAATTITAPMAGTVTAVNANVGANPTGVAFVIEDLSGLVIDSSVKEYDVNSVAPGTPVTIEADATRDAVYTGKVASIAPTSDKDATGNTVTGSDIQYSTKVDVTSTDTKLKVGMNVRINYVLDKQSGVFAVPIDAVRKSAQGATTVLAAVKDAAGKTVLREVPVTTGLANDLSVAISGQGVVDGLRVVTNPAGLAAGTAVTIYG